MNNSKVRLFQMKLLKCVQIKHFGQFFNDVDNSFRSEIKRISWGSLITCE